MSLSPFHAYYLARTLSGYAYGRDKLMAALASSDIEVYPHQVAAALFCLRSPYLKGAVLCDDGSLGKTYEALLAISQKWYESFDKILIIVPTPLLQQWINLIDQRFAVPLFTVADESAWKADFVNPFRQPGLVITTYDFAAEKEAYVAQVAWDVVIYEEAHHLRRAHTGENVKLNALKSATAGAFKLLLTATPIQNSILDIYGLINFIDDRVFLDEDSFYRRYFRQPKNYAELAQRVAPYCFRTKRAEVENYLKIPKRIPITHEYTLTEPEQKLKNRLEDYLAKEKKIAFPKMERYDLTLMLLKIFSSSYAAFEKTLQSIVRRLEKIKNDSPSAAQELQEFQTMLEMAANIKGGAKSKVLLAALKAGFSELKKLGTKAKALIFTENVSTQKYLYKLLNQGQYQGQVLTYSGANSRDYGVIEKFRDEARILIATDIAAEGFNLEFCSLVINYDLPYNALTIEQRISRCHRQGQQSDVIVLNFLNRDNFADVRILELINKRLLQFDGVFGLADDWLGDFSGDLKKVLSAARSKDEIDKTFDNILEQHKEENKALVKSAYEALFSSFTPEVSRAVSISPKYAQDKIKEINDALWQVTQYFFSGKDGYFLDDETRTLKVGLQPQKVFTGSRLGRREYSMTDRSLPKSGWYTVSSPLAKNILHEIFWQGIPDQGQVWLEGVLEACTIGFYQVKIKSAKNNWARPGGFNPAETLENSQSGGGALPLWGWDDWRYYVFAGRTEGGRILSDEDCREIMKRPVVKFSAHREIYGARDGLSKPKAPVDLDKLIDPAPFIQKTLEDAELAENEEIKRLKAYALDAKIDLERKLDQLKREMNKAAGELSQTARVIDKLQVLKLANNRRAELKRREESLFLDKQKLEIDLKKQIENIKAKAKLAATVERLFMVEFRGQDGRS